MMNNNKRILCVGMCVLDIIHVCEKYPQEDTDKRCLKGHWQRGGNASNNCTVLRQLNASCEFLGMLSESKGFQFLIEDCTKYNILIDNCPKVNLDPPFSSVILSQSINSRTIIHSNSNFPILKYEHFKNVNLFNYSWIHFEARNPEETELMIESIVQHNENNPNHYIQISIDLEKTKPEILNLTKYVNFIFLGKDLALFLNCMNSKDAVYSLREKIDNKETTIICPWGEDGCSVLSKTNEYKHIESYPPKEIIDTLGAGDTFCAGTIFALNNGKTSFEAVEFGNRLAGFKLSFYGYDQINNFSI